MRISESPRWHPRCTWGLLALLLLSPAPFGEATTCSPCTASLVLESLGVYGGGTGPPTYRVHRHSPHTEQPVSHAMEPNMPTDYLIRVNFYDTYASEGWDRLQIAVNAKVPIPDTVKAHAAGFAEAFFSAEAIYNYWDNYRRNEYRISGGQLNPGLIEFVEKQVGRLRDKVERKANCSKYYSLMELVLAQFDGLVEGYWRNIGHSDKNLTWHELYLLQSVGDLYDLNVLFPPEPASTEPPTASSEAASTATATTNRQLPPQLSQYQRRYTPGHGVVSQEGYGELLECSAIIKLDNASFSARRWQVEREGTKTDGNRQPGWDGGQDAGWWRTVQRRAVRSQTVRDDGDDDGSGGGLCSGVKPQSAQHAQPTQRQGRITHSAARTHSFTRQRTGTRKQMLETHTSVGTLGSSWWRRLGQWLARQWGVLSGWRTPQAVESVESGQHGIGKKKSKARLVKFWAGHTTWRPYYAMRRTWKVYDFPWIETGPLVVSSSPGLIYSKDDWYSTDRLVVMETTNGIYNKTLYDSIKPDCALMWQRVLVANWGASSGAEWAQLFQKGNSGTYNNQWMVLDVRALQNAWLHDVLWVLEQIPGQVVKADVTSQLLQQGYWMSFNVPYFTQIYNVSGYPVDQDLWHTSPRARIFAREAPSLNSMSALKRLLRLNRYQEDPLSEGRPNNAIAARYDLTPLSGFRQNWTRRAFGAVDAKAVDARSFISRTTHVVSGPTTDDQVPFRWSTSGFEEEVAHAGLVDQFAFGWQQYQSPSTMSGSGRLPEDTK